jgi:hypothetical protein
VKAPADIFPYRGSWIWSEVLQVTTSMISKVLVPVLVSANDTGNVLVGEADVDLQPRHPSFITGV